MRSTKLLAFLAGALAILAVAAMIYTRSSPPDGREQTPVTAAPASPVGPERVAEAVRPVPSAPAPRPGPETEVPSMVQAITATPLDATTRALTEELLHGDEAGRAHAISELGFLDDPRWVPVVIAVLARDGHASVRSAAAAALATQSSSPAAAHALSSALTDADPGVRQDALLSLKAIRNSTVEKDLRNQLASNQLDEDTARETRLFLDRYYVRKDPLYDPLAE